MQRLAYRSSAQTVRFAWRTVILAIVFGSAVFVIVPLTTSKPVKKEKTLIVQKAPVVVKLEVPEKKRIFELWSTDQNGKIVSHGHDFSIDEPTCISKTYKAWKEGKETFKVDLKGLKKSNNEN